MTEPTFKDRTRPSLWESIGGVLIAAAALFLLSGVAYAWANEHASFGNRLDSMASAGANIITAALVLAAVLALMHRGPDADPARSRAQLVIALAIGAIVVLASLASAIHLVTADRSDFAIPDARWQFRVAQILPRIASAIVAGVAAVLANRTAPSTR